MSTAAGKKGEKEEGKTDIELPPFHVLASILVRNHEHQLRDLAAHHPLVQLRHDLLDVRLDLVVGRDEHVQAIFLDGGEVLGRVDSSLESASKDQRLETSEAH